MIAWLDVFPGNTLFDPRQNIVEWVRFCQRRDAPQESRVELADIRSRMEAALDAGAIGTWSWDIKEDRFYGDASFAKIFDVDLSTVSGGKISEILPAIHADDIPRVERLISEAIKPVISMKPAID